MRVLLIATILLLPAVPVAAQPTTGWTFDVLTMWHSLGSSTIKTEPYGVFTSSDECQIARAKKNVELDHRNLRQPHILPDQPGEKATISVGATTISKETPGGPIETMFVTDCRDDDAGR
jgi:hypothetical protein